MPTRIPNPLLFWIAKVTDRHVAHALEFLKAENEILRSKLPKQFTTTLAERRRLIKLAKSLGTALRSLITLVTYTTLLRLQRALGKKRVPQPIKKPGRPKTSESTSDIILRFARDNGWGLTRILGEMRKLGLRVGRTMIRNILRKNGLHPTPKGGPDSWADFLKRHTQTLWACDFLSKRIWTQSGFVDCFVLFYIHVSTRRVHLAGVTVSPNRIWLAQQARNATIFFDEQPAKPAILIHDRDGKFPPHFESILHSSGVETIVLPPNSPNLNAYAERWVQSFRQECLDHFMVFGEEHMRLIAQQYVDWYNTYRPHQALNNEPLLTSSAPPSLDTPQPDQIRCQSWLGGLLNHYHRAAA